MPRWLDAVLGRSKPVQPDLDQLFGLPSAAVTLRAATAFAPTGVGSVAVKAAEGGAYAGLEEEIGRLLALDGDRYRRESDRYGFDWLVRKADPSDLPDLVTDLHGVNTTLQSGGFGPLLLCTVVGFTDGARRLALVYLYKRGSWYPFAPAGPDRRDNALELQVRGLLADDLRLEPDLARWFPVWGAPGL